ncbi:MAG: winged helix-turn-helix domain-containing protein [Thermodesulfobacteriota bacterium]|nr:winged helix-turn-helix domain-containing protein [Thermodesulfobacteriota bacterium]
MRRSAQRAHEILTDRKPQKGIEKEFGISIGTTPLWKHLKKMGLVLKNPRSFHAKAGRGAQEAFKKA